MSFVYNVVYYDVGDVKYYNVATKKASLKDALDCANEYKKRGVRAYSDIKLSEDRITSFFNMGRKLVKVSHQLKYEGDILIERVMAVPV